MMPIAATNALSLLRLPGDTVTQKLLLLTSSAAVATTITYADASVASVALVIVLKVICCCYRNCDYAITTTNALSLVRVPGQSATLPLLMLTSFATIPTTIAFAHASVARLAVLTAVIVPMS